MYLWRNYGRNAEIILETGLDTIQNATKQITEELIDRLKKAGFILRTAPNSSDRSAIVMIPHPNPASAVRALSKRSIIVYYRGDCIRVSPYFYNNSEDIETFVTALQEMS